VRSTNEIVDLQGVLKDTGEMPEERHNSFVVLEKIKSGNQRQVWKVRCDCGSVRTLQKALVVGRKAYKSCGCRRREHMSLSIRRHGMAASSEHGIWRAMRARCANPTTTGYDLYGGRGIYVCERWSVFENFLADMGPRPSKRHSIDRIDNDGPYSPDNCRWATLEEQNRNRRVALYVQTSRGRMHLKDAEAIAGVPYQTIRWRLLAGWDPEKAVTRPCQPKRRRAA
jgi:hypothetical protein